MQPKTITEELLGSQCGVAKKICDPKIIRWFINICKKFLCQRNLRVNNLAEIRIGDVSEVSFKSPGNQIVQEQHNYGGLTREE